MRSRNTQVTDKRGGGWRRFFGFLIIVSLGAVAGGFLVFAHHVDQGRTEQSIPIVDGIVVWTGPGGGRLERAGELLDGGYGERLLVSGVNTSLSLEQVTELASISADAADCCVDIDYAALDTRGNARETARWVEALSYQHILLVTSAYHMPRAQLEIAQQKPSLQITPVAVRSAPETRWWRDGDRFKRLAGEYGKYLLSLSRGRSASQTSHDPVLPEDEIASPQPDPTNTAEQPSGT